MDEKEAIGFMIIRAWVEPRSEAPLRVRVRLGDDPDVESLYMTDAEQVGRMVETWLTDLVQSAK